MTGTFCRKQHVVFALGALALLALIFVAFANRRALVSRWVTWRALETANGALPPVVPPATGIDLDALKAVRKLIVEQYGSLLKRNYFDREYWLRQHSGDGVVRESYAPLCVFEAYCVVNEGRFERSTDPFPEFADEISIWASLVARSSTAKKLLVNLLTKDYEVENFPDEGLIKKILCDSILPYETQQYEKREPPHEKTRFISTVLDRVTEQDWNNVLLDTAHTDGRVRAGALLLLGHYPSDAGFFEHVLHGLQDDSSWVRLAAAGMAASRDNASGERVLLSGLAHARWEIRWWCAAALTRLRNPSSSAAIRAQQAVEPDKWLRREMGQMLEAIAKAN